MNPGGEFEASMVGPLVILVVLVVRQIVKGSSKSGIFLGMPFVSHFLVVCFSLVIET